jgi:hypothetical protein
MGVILSKSSVAASVASECAGCFERVPEFEDKANRQAWQLRPDIVKEVEDLQMRGQTPPAVAVRQQRKSVTIDSDLDAVAQAALTLQASWQEKAVAAAAGTGEAAAAAADESPATAGCGEEPEMQEDAGKQAKAAEAPLQTVDLNKAWVRELPSPTRARARHVASPGPEAPAMFAAASSADTPSPSSADRPSGDVTCLTSLWGDVVAHYLTMPELERLCLSSSDVHQELTVEVADSSSDSSKRRLISPVVELKIETAEVALSRASLPHIRTLRVWKRLSYEALNTAVSNAGGPAACAHLERMAFKGCPLYPDDIKMLIAPIFRSVRTLNHLNLEKNGVTDDTIISLVDSGALAAAKLESMNLRFNNISDKGVKKLVSCESFASLKWINLKMNKVGDDGAIALAEALRGDTCAMKLLNLRRQVPCLSDKTAVAFAETLRTNSTLEQLRLRKNHIGDAGAAALGSAAAEHFRLMLRNEGANFRFELDLEDNQIRAKGGLALLRSLVGAPEMAHIELLVHGNRMDRDAVKEAAAASPSTPAYLAEDTRLSFISKDEAIVR